MTLVCVLDTICLLDCRSSVLNAIFIILFVYFLRYAMRTVTTFMRPRSPVMLRTNAFYDIDFIRLLCFTASLNSTLILLLCKSFLFILHIPADIYFDFFIFVPWIICFWFYLHRYPYGFLSNSIVTCLPIMYYHLGRVNPEKGVTH